MEEKHSNLSQISSAPPTFEQAVYGRGPEYYPPQPIPTTAPYVQQQGYYPPQPHQPYPTTAQNAPQQVVITVAPAIELGPTPTIVNCPHCRKTVTTLTESEPSNTAHIAAFILFLVGCWPCCCIPYCMDSFQNVQHRCPSCGNFLGAYKP